MKVTAINASKLFQDHVEVLNWRWLAGQQAAERRFDDTVVRQARSSADLVGYLNYIHPHRAQILGTREVCYLNAGSATDMARRIARILTLEPPVLIVCDDQPPPALLIATCEREQIPLFATAQSAAYVIETLRIYLAKHFAERTSLHGVFMDILGLGVLITGESGLGKSELGLELITRGSGLVADDVVDFYLINQSTIEGRSPELLQNLLEVRGIGLLNIFSIFGEAAVRRRMRLRLIVHLEHCESPRQDPSDRLPAAPKAQDILGVSIEKVTIQVLAGRNLAVLVEAAVRNHILHLRGIDSYQEFIARQRKAMQQDRPDPA